MNKNRELKFVSKKRGPNGPLAKGLYQLLSVEEKENERIEKWKQPGENQGEIEITVPSGISSLPGMGFLAPRILSHSNATLQISNFYVQSVQNSIKLSQNLNDYLTHYIKPKAAIGLLITVEI